MKSLTHNNQFFFRSIEVPQLPSVPSLTTEDDQHYLYWLTSHMFEDEGSVVEIGTWFGSSAGYLAAGLRDAKSIATLYCIDRFQFSPTDPAKCAEQGFNYHLMRGQDTVPVVQKHLEPIYNRLHFIKSDIEHVTWNHGPIELLHLDAPKRWSDVMHILKIIQPFLIPKKSVIVVQDFCVPRAYALPLIFGALHDSFTLVHIPSEHSTMAVFEYQKEYSIDDKLIINNWNQTKVIEIWEQISANFSSEQKDALELGLAYYFYDNGNKDMAELILSKIRNLV